MAYNSPKQKKKYKLVKSFYYSTIDFGDEAAEELGKYNPEKAKAYKLAKKIKGIVRTKFVPEDEGREYRVYKKVK